jgi:alpha-D-ribose 1-methylphosphonate 5-triphosphate synthase subunit PhnG
MTSPMANGDSAGTPARRELMRACAEANEAEMEAAVAALGDLAPFDDIRPPQTGLLMLRGRIGGDGPPFNIGEATMTRAAVRLASGEMGFAYLLGRSHRRARLAALLDALGQDEGRRTALQQVLVEPVMARRERERARRGAETAATRVDFFTLVRGEDQG